MLVRSLWAELGVVWVTGVLLGWVVDRADWVWLVVGSVVVAVDMGFLLVNLEKRRVGGGLLGGRRSLSGGIGSGWFPRVFRSACHATVGFLVRVRTGSR
jgi:hypothetical protein